ncbi:MAG: tetratricopeptide repeat protein, partial [Nitrospinota bacterium]
HGERTHAIFIYNATIWVPLVMKLPGGQNAGAVIERMTRHIDILPTMVDIAGIGERVPREMKSDMHGVSLTAFINGEGGDGQDIRLLSYAESYYPKLYYGWAAPVSIRAEGYEYIDLPINEFYDLENDPSELNNIYEKSGERAEKYALKLEEIKKKYGRGETGDARRSMDKETVQKLKSLGYIHGDAGVSFSDGKIDGKGGERGKDPKTVIEIAGKLEEMENLMEEKNYPRVMELGEKALDSDPENIHILFMLAQSYVETGDTKKAVLRYETIKKLYPRYVPAYVGLLDIYTLMEKKFDAAQKELNTAFAVAPGDPTLWIAKGNLDMKKGDLREAEQSFLKALGMGEQSESLFVGLAGLYAIEGKFKKAEEFFLKAIRVNFGYAHAHYGLGLMYEAVNRQSDAEKEYRLAIGFDGNNPKYSLSLGSLLAKRKRYDEAMAFLEKAVAIAPDYHEALQNLGTVYMETGNLHKAEQLLKKAIGLKPGIAHAYVSLAGTYLKMGDTEKAFSVFHKITKVAPEMPLPWYQMALIAAAGKRNGEAQKYLKKAIEKGGPQVAATASKDEALKEIAGRLRKLN